MALSEEQRNRIYGAPGKVSTRLVTTPWGIRVQVHPLVVDVFLDACREADRVSGWKPRRIDGYNHRPIRASTKPSMHGYALAWDFFATPPNVAPPGGVWTPDNGMPADFARCFTRRGFTWGAVWKRKDVPHIEWAAGPPGPQYVSADEPAHQPARFLPMLSDAEQTELLTRVRSLEHTVSSLHQANQQHTKDMRDSIAALIRERHEAMVAHSYELRNTMAALTRRLFGVDPDKKNDTEPFWAVKK